MTSPNDFSLSKRIPLSVLVRALARDKHLIEKALHILSVEDPESTHTEATAVSELLNHWLVNRELGYYINGQRGDDITALTVIPVNGDYGKGLAAMEAWITIDKQELVELLRSRDISMPDNLANAKADQAPNWDKWRLIPDPMLWECVLLSLNVDPDNVREKRPLISSTRPSDPIFQDKEYKDRIHVAESNLRHTLRPKWGARDGPQVSLREFAAWVERIGWGAPPELLAIGHQRPQNVNWNYWLALDLWPLDTACKLICGYDPSEPRREDIDNPDIDSRPMWVNLYHQAVSAIKAGNLIDVNGEMTPSAFIAWAAKKGCSAPPGVVAMADQQVAKTADRAGSEKRTAPTASKKARTVDDQGDNVFKKMDGLTWNDIIITFIESEAVRIKARGKSETFTYDAMGFKNRNLLNAKPNKVWDTLRTLAIVTNTDKTLTDALPPQTDFKRRVSRLRDALKKFFGIKDNPISYVGTAYKPVFILTAEEDVLRGVHEQTVPDDEDEGGIEALMARPPGR